ncbi:MAG: HNH endonuclease [Robiginitomaculum sp.]|nr:HNH endonuclease [Robiginitomaculum sp.]
MGKLWQRPEQMLALELYCRTPFGKIHSRNPDIMNLAKILDRTPASVSLKMANFAALDPTIDRKGMGNYSKSDAIIWEEFFDNPTAFLSQVERQHTFKSNQSYEFSTPSIREEFREGTDVLVQTKSRRHQDFFRRMLISTYGGKCALTSIAQPELLIASHIKPWSVDKKARLNPRNGILLNALHDRAFDKGLISFSDNMDLLISKNFNFSEIAKPFFENSKFNSPEKFHPDPIFLQYHREVIFEKGLKCTS